MEYLYLACTVITLGMLFWLKLLDARNSTTQFVTLLAVVVSNLGFYFVSTSTSIEEAILAQILSYVGGVFLPVFFFLLMLEVCHIELPRFVSVIMLSVQCAIYFLVCTIGSNDLFYRTVELRITNGTSVLHRSYGPLHTIYLTSMYIYLAASVAVAIYSLVNKKRTVNRRGIIAMTFLCLGVAGIYVVEKVIGLKYDIIPVAYVLGLLGALIPIYRYNLFTVYENKDIINEQFEKIGFLTFNKNLVYQDSNDFMSRVFPELAKYRVGQKIQGCSAELQVLIDQVDLHKESHAVKTKDKHTHRKIEAFWLGDKCYEGIIHTVTNTFGAVKGYTIELQDDTADRKVIELTERYNEELTRDVHAKTKRIRFIQQKTIMGMAQMVESRDLSTGGHIKRTSDVVRIFAKKLEKVEFGLDKRFLHLIIRSAPMHDLGKIGVDDAILRKQGRFTDEEYEQMKKHSEIGYHMVSEILSEVEEPDFVRVAENVAHYHHEKVNGTGYPHGLKGEEIPIEARIMALADVFDALVSKRCYKDAFSYDKAFDIIKNDSGSHFDSSLAEVFISCRPELEEYYNKSDE